MIKFYALICALAFQICLEASAQEKMVKFQVNDEISYRIPASFTLMAQTEQVQKFVFNRSPLAIHSSRDGEVNMAVNQNQMQWAEGDEEMIYGFYKASIQSMFDGIEFIQEGIQEVNGKKFIVFEFISSLKDENTFASTKSSKNYTYIQYTSYQDQVLLFNFGCKARFMRDWQSIAQEVMQSVVIKSK